MDEIVASSTIKLDGGSDNLKYLLKAMQYKEAAVYLPNSR